MKLIRDVTTSTGPGRILALAAAGVLMMPQLGRAAPILAELPEPGGYMSGGRIFMILIFLFLWLVFAQWVEKDLLYVRKLNRDVWKSVVLFGGLLGFVVWLIMPWTSLGLFLAGFGLWFVLTVGACAVYVIVRNGVVDPSARVFTPKHIKQWFSTLGKGKEQKAAAVERVRLNGADGKKVPPPSDPTQAEPYEAAQKLLYDALWRRASEVEMLVASNASKLIYRIDGVATPRNDLMDRDDAERALGFVKRTAGLDIAEHRRPQEGRISGSIGTDRGMTEIEVHTSGTTQHERLSLRIVGEETRLRLRDLGMSDTMREQLVAAVEPAGGLVLVAGPRASGVTTTLYALLRNHDAFMENLLTMEREPLMDLENITQHTYEPDKHDGSYARQLQTVLRREPDVVMISDCSDRETAHLAVKGAQDGKKIYMGIQAKDCFEALKKVISLAADTDGVADVLRCVTAQRLLRKLCVACRLAYKPDPNLLRKANLPLDRIEHFYRAPKAEERVDEKGNPVICPNCQDSGYFGRTGLFELLVLDDAMRDLVRNGQPVSTVRAQARKNGMLYLQETGLQKVIQGMTGMNEMLRVLRDEDNGAARTGRKGG